MTVCVWSTIFLLASIWIPCSSNGADSEEGYKPRRWSAAGDGPYRLVVSSEAAETLSGQESVSLAVASEKKKKEKSSEEEYDKVTQRMILKRGRKRAEEQRKRRRGGSLATTPQTMSLYNHFRPLEHDLPRDTLNPFLEFGRKLSTGSTPANSIESSSTPRGEPPPRSREEDDTREEDDMDLTVTRKAVERNTPPRGPIQARGSIAALFRRNVTQLVPIDRSNNKTDIKNIQYDLQSNESGIKLHAVLSPDYGLRLNKSETTTEKPENMTEVKLTDPAVNISQPETNTSSEISPSPKPTARVLSTAVVTSVSVKETPWLPRIRANLTHYQRMKNVTETPVPERIKADNLTLIAQQNRRKMYSTLRPKTTSYKPVTFRSAFRRNSTGVVHIVSTPPTYIEVPKILKTTAKELELEALVSSTAEPDVFPNLTLVSEPPVVSFRQKPLYSSVITSPPVLSSTEPSSTTSSTVASTPMVPSTTPTITEPSTTASTTVLTTPSTTVSTTPSTTVSTTPSTTVSTTESTTTTTPTPQPTTPEEAPSAPDDYQPTAADEHLEDFPDDQTTQEHTSVQTELKLLDGEPPTQAVPPQNVTTRRPGLLWIYSQRNQSGAAVRTQNVGPSPAYSDSQLGLLTYVLAGLALIPLILGLSVLARQVFRKSKKKVLDESEYSSEYNRTPLPTKLPRVPAHINWEGEKQTPLAPQTTTAPIPVTKWEFSRDKLRLQTVLGQGNFGQVWKAEADDLCGHEGSTRLVAVKTVKEGASQREKEDLLRELGIMQELGAHPNVVTLLGCCTDKEPYLLIMEYVMYGKLLAFLREHRTRAHYFNFSDLSSALTSRDLTFFSYCVARGMEYLVTKGIIHRDLAARNILVDHTKLCKIADFGMSRNVRDTGQIYEQRPNRGALPIRWMAPESLHLSLFTHKSDVWSFGILLWEIITLGSTPYNKMGAREVMRQVREGYRLEKPKHCRTEFYKVVSKCWSDDPSQRPNFTELKQDLASLLADEATNGEYVDLEALTEEMCDQGS